jgi:hypothetical protein
MTALSGAAMLMIVFAFASPKTRGLAVVALGFLLWINPGVFAGVLMLIGIVWYAVS